MTNHFDDAWSNAYDQVDLPDTISEYAQAASTAFDARIVASRPTEARFDQFNRTYVAGRSYINVDTNVSFINTTGHEIYHAIGKIG